MLWVLWDMLVPLLVTFSIGLGTGWLMWRWRRQKVSSYGSQSVSVLATDQNITADESVNVILIEERDEAVARAEKAEAELELLQLGIDDSVFELDTTKTASVEGQYDEDWPVEHTTAELQALAAELEKEKASKAEMELVLAGLNSRYTQLVAQLEDAVSSDDAVSIKEVAVLESNYEQSLQQISKQEKSIQQLAKKERAIKEDFGKEIAAKDAELASLYREKERLQEQLLSQSVADESDLDKHSAKGRKVASGLPVKAEKVSKLSSYSADAAERKSARSQTPETAAQASSLAIGSGVATASVRSQSELSPESVDETAQQQKQPEIKVEAESGAEIQRDSESGASAAGSKHPNNDQALTGDQPGADKTVAAVVDSDKDKKETRRNVTSINTANSKKTKSAEKTEGGQDPGLDKALATAYKPAGWEVPEHAPAKSERDNLRAIKGVGPVLEKMLHTVGIYHYNQIASLDKQGIAELDSLIPQFSGRIERDDWVGQASELDRVSS